MSFVNLPDGRSAVNADLDALDQERGRCQSPKGDDSETSSASDSENSKSEETSHWRSQRLTDGEPIAGGNASLLSSRRQKKLRNKHQERPPATKKPERPTINVAEIVKEVAPDLTPAQIKLMKKVMSFNLA